MNEERNRMNLQLFAEGGPEAAATGEAAEGQASAAGGAAEPEKTLTQAEVDALIERRLARERRDAEKRTAEAVEKARAEAEERARMSEADRAKSDREKAERAAREREEKLSAREQEITRRELRASAVDQLAEKGLPKELAKLLDYSSEEACQESMNNVESVFRASVQAGIEARIARGGARMEGSSGAKPDFDKMSDAEYYASLGRAATVQLNTDGLPFLHGQAG